MDNHIDIIIDSNGADISKIMHCINFKYVSYFNRKYQRHGHLFQDRFKSKIVHDERYLFSLTAYIHNNPSDLPGYRNDIKNYYFSSFEVCIGSRKDFFNLVDYKFILSLLGENLIKSRKRYIKLVLKSKALIEEVDAEFENEATEYRSERKILIRDFKTEDITEYISKIMNISKSNLYVKYNKKLVNSRALLVFLLRSLCNASCKEICCILGNITQSRVSKLCYIVKDLIFNNEKYKNIICEFIENCP